MRCTRFSRLAVAIATFAAAIAPVMAQPLTVDEFRRELVGVPLCGTPDSGPLAGKALCTVHLPDNGQICRRNQHDAADKQRCVTYERVDRSHFRNSDGVAFCLGPCETDQ